MKNNSSPDEPSSSGLTTRRIEAFSDGVFAIVITLMAFQIKIPPIDPLFAAQQLPKALWSLWPEFYSYGLSFFMVGVYWIGHHNAYHHINRTDRPLLWFNLVSLMLVALLPFSTSLLGRYMNFQLAHIVYGVNIIVIGIANYYQWRYARTRGLVNVKMERWFIRKTNKRLLLAPGVAVGAILLSFINLHASALLYLSIILYYLFPTAIDRAVE